MRRHISFAATLSIVILLGRSAPGAEYYVSPGESIQAAMNGCVHGDTVTLRGERKPDEIEEGDAFHRQERGHGKFVRTIQLPHQVDADNVQAHYAKGVLRLTLPRAEADKPRQISVKNV